MTEKTEIIKMEEVKDIKHIPEKCQYIHSYGDHKGEQCTRNATDATFCTHHKEFINGRCIGHIGAGPNKGKQCEKACMKDSKFCGKHTGSAAKLIKIAESGKFKCYTHRCTNEVSTEKTYCLECIAKKDTIKTEKNRCASIIMQGENKGKQCEILTDGKYCNMHIRRETLIEVAKISGKKVCGDGVRCENIISLDKRLCEECTLKARISDMKRYYARANDETCCIDCGKKDVSFASTSNETTSRYCISCYEKMRKIEDKRNRASGKEGFSNPVRYYNSYAHDADRKDREFNISYEEFIKIVSKPCTYCGKYEETEYNGVDRVNNNEPYTVANCVSACKLCNYFKSDHNVDRFINHCAAIALFQTSKIVSPNRLIWESANNRSFSVFKKQSADRRDLEFKIDEKLYITLKNSDCYLCGNSASAKSFNGIDRIDSSKGYILENVAPCCPYCNRMKNEFSFDIFTAQCRRIAVFNKLLILSSDKTEEDSKILKDIKKSVRRPAAGGAGAAGAELISESSSDHKVRNIISEVKPNVITYAKIESESEHATKVLPIHKVIKKNIISEAKSDDIAHVKIEPKTAVAAAIASKTIPYNEFRDVKQWKSSIIYTAFTWNYEHVYKKYCEENNKIVDSIEWNSDWDKFSSEVKKCTSESDAISIITKFVEKLKKIRNIAIHAKRTSEKEVVISEDSERVEASTILKLHKNNRLIEFKHLNEKWYGSTGEDWEKRWNKFVANIETSKTDEDGLLIIRRFMAAYKQARFKLSHSEKKE